MDLQLLSSQAMVWTARQSGNAIKHYAEHVGAEVELA